VKIRLLLLAALSVMGTLLAARGLLGPLTSPLTVNSPMNLEGVFALAFLGLLAARDAREAGAPGGSARKRDLYLAAALAVIVIAAFVRDLDFPLLADDYIHIWNARHADWRAILAHVTAPETDHFFRPAVYWSYAFDALWAGVSPTTWRAGNLAIHVVNTLLVYWLCRDVRFARTGAFIGALVFGLHGSRPEAVTWVAARFDLMAVMFSLGCVLAVLNSAKWWIGCSLFAMALMSKESAYVTPLVAALVLRYVGLHWRAIRKPVAPLFGIAAVALMYRLWLLHGIGGYRDPVSGSAVVLHPALMPTLNAVFLRFWAALMFPLNWTGELSTLTGAALAAAIAAYIYIAWQGTERRKASLGILVAVTCSLPAYQFLSIGMDLEKSRVLYFSSVGLALLFAAVFERNDIKLMLCAVALVGFEWIALQNNLGHWRHVGELAGRTCAAQAKAPAEQRAQQPNVVDGVYFLRMGLPECVMLLNGK
jgi:hypothetical protein